MQVPDKVVAATGQQQVGAVTSGERGTLVTVTFAGSAQGIHVPPFFIFARKKYKDHFIRDGPAGSIGSANGSGWMQEAEFVLFLQHFTNHTRMSKESMLLCSHRLQPLDRSVFGPLKHYVNTASDLWMKNHPGQQMTIYDVHS